MVIKSELSHLGRIENFEMTNAILDCLYESICVINADGVVVYWNKRSEALYKVQANDILGKPITSFFPTALLEEVRLSRSPHENVLHTPREGTQILITSFPLFSSDGEFLGAVSTDRDYAEVSKLYSKLGTAESKVLFLENEIKRFSSNFGDIIGSSPKLMKKITVARQIAPADTSVMLSGESGTGKEVFARGIHELSGRKGLFVPVNCSAIPSELFESEFFGYAPGAFTGAGRSGKPGIFELAQDGTVFLDEIGDMPQFIQGKLLRVLQERELTRVGATKNIKLDIRVISATNRPLKEMVNNGSFREDLYYRLNVVEIELPALRERREDIPLLVNHFNKLFSMKNRKPIKSLSSAALLTLLNYEWPGNIRELMNVLEHMVVTSSSKNLTPTDIPNYIAEHRRETKEEKEVYPLDLNQAVRSLEAKNIKKALELASYNKSRAAILLGIPRATLYYKANEYGISLNNAW